MQIASRGEGEKPGNQNAANVDADHMAAVCCHVVFSGGDVGTGYALQYDQGEQVNRSKVTQKLRAHGCRN